MPDAAERIRVEPRPSSAKRAKTPAPGRKWTRALMALTPKSRRGVAGAALVAMMIGIVVNAVALQHGRRPELLAGPTATASVKSPAPVAASSHSPAATAVASAPASDQPPTPPTRPASTALALARAAKPADPIADFLRGNAGESRRLVSATQGALTKLGYSVRTTGALDSETRSALIEFEKSRHMPVSTEITSKLVKTLTAAVAAN